MLPANKQMPVIDPSQLDVPPDLRNSLCRYVWNQQTIGYSAASVFRLDAGGRPSVFVKIGQCGPFDECAGEAARLEWLSDRGVSCPRVLAFEVHNGRNWLLTAAIPGRDLASSPHIAPASVIGIAAGALRDLHRLDVRACPFDHRLDQQIGLVRTRVEAGVVDTANFDEERQGETADGLYARLLALRPDSEDLVVAHGDACLPNLMAAENRFSGFVDCGRLGVADRYQDLALACRSIRHNLGGEWVQPFLALYGLPAADPARLAYYRLLDEFF